MHLLLVVALAAGCGDSAGVADGGADAPADDAGATDEALLEQYFTALDVERCRLAVLCESRELLRWDLFPDLRISSQLGCHPAFERARDEPEVVVRRALRAGFAAGRIALDREALRDCLELLPGADFCDPVGGPTFPAPCNEVLVPLVEEGGACHRTGDHPRSARTQECTGDLRCPAPAGCDGTCAPGAVDGEPCPSQYDCAAGHYCDVDAIVCRRFAGAGEPCGEAPRCGADLYCRDGLCAEAVAPGAPCDPEYEDVCRGAFACLPTGGSSLCLDPSEPREGGPCDALVYDLCPPALACYAGGRDAVVGRCFPPRAEGVACSEIEPCGRALRCVDGACRHIALPGAVCGANAVCPLTHHCAPPGRCEPLPLLGESCAASGRCFEGMCLGGTCALAPLGAPCDGIARAPLGACADGTCSEQTTGSCTAAAAEGETCIYDHECASPLVCAVRPGADSLCTAWCGLALEHAR